MQLFKRFGLPITIAMSVPMTAHVQEAATEEGLTEIVVTAQRQAQTEMSVPLSIQALTGEELTNAGIKDIADLQFTTPGFLPSKSEGYNQLYIRGVGNNIFAGADPSVATYVDDVPRLYGSMVTQLVDVDRVEILKGAQGGLYGRNATGGVLNIITHQPNTNEFSGHALVDYGEYDTFRAAGYVNLPLNDRIALTLAAERESHHPYVTNISTDPAPYTASMFPGGSVLGSAAQTAAFFNSGVQPPKGLDDENFWAADGKLLVRLTDSLKITLAGDYSHKNDADGGGIYQGQPQFTQAVLTGFIDAFTGANVQLPAGFSKCCNGKFTTSVGSPVFVDLQDYGGSATALWNAPGFDLTAISAYRVQHTEFASDIAPNTTPLLGYASHNEKWFSYQELRAVSTSAGPIHWLGGATYLSNHFEGYSQANLIYPLVVLPATQTLTAIHDWSAYLQAGYDFNAHINLTASGRYIHETNETLFTAPVEVAANGTERKWLPSATLSYKLDDGVIYARWARGFKAGGVNPTAPANAFPRPQDGSVFGPETVDTYEAGFRDTLLDHKLQLTTAAFYNDYRGLQTVAHAQPAYAAAITLAIVNAGSARTWGFEETARYQLIRPLTIGVSAGYLNAKYTDFAIVNNPVLENFSLSGTTMLNSPKLQGTASAELDQPLNDRFRLVGNLVESYVGSVLFVQSGAPGILPAGEGPGYWLTNLRLGVKTADGRYGIAFFANNLFDRPYITYASSASTSGNNYTWGTPRVIGGEFTVDF